MGVDRSIHQKFMKTAPTLTHNRSKAMISSPLDQNFTENKEYSSNGRSIIKITDKICSKNEIKSKACISAAVLPISEVNNSSRSTTPIKNISSNQA